MRLCTPKWCSYFYSRSCCRKCCWYFGEILISSRFRYLTQPDWLRLNSRPVNVCLFVIKFFTMLGMWIIPLGISIKLLYGRFILIWTVFTIITLFVAYKATRVPIGRSTPRLVYKWFLLLHKVTYFLGVFGYISLMLTFLGLNFLVLISPAVNDLFSFLKILRFSLDYK